MTSELVCAVSIRDLPDILKTTEEVSREKQVAPQPTCPALQSPAYRLPEAGMQCAHDANTMCDMFYPQSAAQRRY